MKMDKKYEIKKYKVILESGEWYTVNGTTMSVMEDGSIKIWKESEENNIFMSISPKGSSVHVFEY